MKLIGFLGTTDYKTTLYKADEAYASSRFSWAALARIFKVDTVRLLATEKAAKAQEISLQEEIAANLPKAEVVVEIIPEGKNEAELWEIFDCIAAQVQPGERVIFDVTFGFRSLPVATILCATYLRKVKDISIEDIYYGARDGRYDEETSEGTRTVTPLFNLTTFVSLLEWLEAATNFTNYGDSKQFADLLAGIQSGKRRAGDQEAPSFFISLANTLKNMSNALLATRLHEVQKHAGQLEKQFTAQLDKEANIWAKPFTLVRKKVSEEYGGFHGMGTLETGIRLVKWYLDRGHLLQAATLLRELFVTRGVVASGKPQAEKDKKYRGLIEKRLNTWGKTGGNSLASLWKQIGDVRNNLAHCGFRTDAGEIKDIEDKVRKYAGEFNKSADNDALWAELFDRAESQERIMLTPYGMSKGLLFTATRKANPDIIIIVTSPEAGKTVEEVLGAAGFAGKWHIVQVEDAFASFQDRERVTREIFRILEIPRKMPQIIVNLTGGPTALHYLVERAAGELVSAGCDVTRVAMVDRRSRQEQEENPFSEGEMIEFTNY